MVDSIQSLLVAIVNAVALVFSGVAVICFIYAGVLFLTAGGDATKLETARSAAIWGTVGVAVGILAFSIIQIMSGVLNQTF